ncbi:PKD domain-containing protein [Methylomonas sp. HYX-M1]|uniref:PKD domain-containing protein n=1 Tax=Methylomonas sp. HYX-M1 TaxID=3139307 RepID=UPI00345BDECE
MNRTTFIVSAVFTALVSDTSTAFAQTQAHHTVFNDAFANAPVQFPIERLHFFDVQTARQALLGYNYALTAQLDGSVEAIVSGLNGSGLQQPLSVVRANAQSSANAANTLVANNDAETPFPQISLKSKANGQAAIDALGERLPEVAKAYDMSAEKLTEILRTDSSAWIDESGRLLYVEEENQAAAPTVPGPKKSGTTDFEQAATVSSTDTFNTIASGTDAFALHSKPGSNRVIYLDFNGHAASSTAWNSGTLNAQAYDTDGVPGTFSSGELSKVKEIWQRVAEDYAPFDVDVTTEEPSADALQRTSSSDAQYGTRAVITRSMPELCSQSCGGIAYLNVFSYYSSSNPDYYRPAWVFFDKLGNGAPKYVAEAVSHEVGHNLNLTHDGNSSVTYYAGHGSGATGWAPIMGSGYYKPATQWSKGEYPNANNLQDDIAVISAAGTPLRADDFADTLANAAPLAGDANAVVQTGVIERRTDLDMFTFYTDGGAVQFNVASGTIASGSNLDISVELLDSAGKVVASANPATSLSASISATLGSGQFYLRIDGVGYGDLTTGYSDYASLGQYQITGSYPKSTVSMMAPTAVMSATPTEGDGPLTASFNGNSSYDQDGSIVGFDWNFGDGSTNATGSSANHTYNTPGNYTATLTVTDNTGLKNSSTQTITVIQAASDANMLVGSTNVTRQLLSGGKSRCVATVTVESAGSIVSGATVYGTWSGSYMPTKGSSKTISGTSSVTTNNAGKAIFYGATLSASTSGTCSFAVTNGEKIGFSYDGSGATSGSFSW